MEMSNQEAFSINEENSTENKDINEENNPDDLQTRKSLYEQLKENKEKKQLEYQKLLESQNSTYKLSGRDADFIKTLRMKERAKEEEIKRQEEKEVNDYRTLKRARSERIIESKPEPRSMQINPILRRRRQKPTEQQKALNLDSLHEDAENNDSETGANSPTNSPSSTAESLKTNKTIDKTTTSTSYLHGYSSSDES